MNFLPGEWKGFPYAVRLAEERGAICVLIQPRVADDAIDGEVRPDVFAFMPSGRPLIIEVEHSSGQKFSKGGPRNREASLLSKADFVFLVGPGGKGRCEKKLREYFGASVELVYLTELQAKYGKLGLASKAVPATR